MLARLFKDQAPAHQRMLCRYVSAPVPNHLQSGGLSVGFACCLSRRRATQSLLDDGLIPAEQHHTRQVRAGANCQRTSPSPNTATPLFSRVCKRIFSLPLIAATGLRLCIPAVGYQYESSPCIRGLGQVVNDQSNHMSRESIPEPSPSHSSHPFWDWAEI